MAECSRRPGRGLAAGGDVNDPIKEQTMTMNFPGTAAVGFVTIAILVVATSSRSDPAAIVAGADDFERQGIRKADLRIRTDAYLVPAHICLDADAEKYEDCVPWSHVGENAIFALPPAE